MAAADCAATGLPLVRGLLTSVDCNVGDIVQGGYAALSDPSGAVSFALTGALTLFVALFGWRLMLGRASLNLGDAAGAAIKIGIVLLLAGSWATYQTLVYNTLYNAPAELAGTLLGSSQNAGSAFRGNPFDGLQLALDQMQSNADFYGQRAGTASPLVGGIAFGAMILNLSALLMLLASLGVIVASKIVLALLLALAPVVAGLLLFDATRGMVEGWLRAMIGLALTPLAVILLLAVELTMLEPALIQIATNREAQRFDIAPILSLGVTILVFAGVMLTAVIAAAMIARGIRLPGRTASAAAATPVAGTSTEAPLAAPTRAARVAQAFEAAARRSAPRAAALAMTVDRRADAVAASGGGRTVRAEGGLAPLGQTYARAAAPRRSAPRSRRDR